MLNIIKNIFYNNRSKDSVFSEIEKFLAYLDETIPLQESRFHQMQFDLVVKAVKVLNAEIYNQQLTKEQALTNFKNSILQQIEIHEHSHYFQGLELAINDYFARKLNA